MPGVRKIDKKLDPKFLMVDQFKLTWSNFTKSDNRPQVDGTPVHAVVAMACEFDFVDKGDVVIYLDSHKKWRLGKVTVKCVMIKEKSLVYAPRLKKNSAEQNAELLKHERVHVELAERHARYIFGKVQELTATGTDLGVVAQQLINAADSIRRNHWNSLAPLNVEYDHQTAHGTKTKTQANWNSTYLSTKNTNSVL